MMALGYSEEIFANQCKEEHNSEEYIQYLTSFGLLLLPPKAAKSGEIIRKKFREFRFLGRPHTATIVALSPR